MLMCLISLSICSIRPPLSASCINNISVTVTAGCSSNLEMFPIFKLFLKFYFIYWKLNRLLFFEAFSTTRLLQFWFCEANISLEKITIKIFTILSFCGFSFFFHKRSLIAYYDLINSLNYSARKKAFCSLLYEE